MKTNLLPLLMPLFFCACKTEHPPEPPNIQTSGKLTIVDSTALDGDFMPYDPEDRGLYLPIFYFDTLQDTIRFGKKPIKGKWVDFEKTYTDYSQFAFPNKNNIKIVVDTDLDLAYQENYWHFKGEEKDFDKEKDDPNEKVMDSTKTYKAYGVIVYNTSDSIVPFSEYNVIMKTWRQAKNENGEWVYIEKPFQYFCGTGSRNIVLEPKQMMVAKLLRYNGDYLTECRLRYYFLSKEVFSNTFLDCIDKRQLTDPLFKN